MVHPWSVDGLSSDGHKTRPTLSETRTRQKRGKTELGKNVSDFR